MFLQSTSSPPDGIAFGQSRSRISSSPGAIARAMFDRVIESEVQAPLLLKASGTCAEADVAGLATEGPVAHSVLTGTAKTEVPRLRVVGSGASGSGRDPEADSTSETSAGPGDPGRTPAREGSSAYGSAPGPGVR